MSSEKDLVIREVTRRKKLLRLDEIDHVLTALDVGTGDGFSALALSSVSDPFSLILISFA
jgi:methylase of polypeptide subunit release factors